MFPPVCVYVFVKEVFPPSITIFPELNEAWVSVLVYVCPFACVGVTTKLVTASLNAASSSFAWIEFNPVIIDEF